MVESGPLLWDEWRTSTLAERVLDLTPVAEFYHQAVGLETFFGLFVFKIGYLR